MGWPSRTSTWPGDRRSGVPLAANHSMSESSSAPIRYITFLMRSPPKFLSGQLPARQLGKQAEVRHQVGVSAALDHAARFQHEDAVRLYHGAQPVSDNDARGVVLASSGFLTSDIVADNATLQIGLAEYEDEVMKQAYPIARSCQLLGFRGAEVAEVSPEPNGEAERAR